MSNPYQTCIANGYAYDASTLAGCLASQAENNFDHVTSVATVKQDPVPYMIFVASLVFFMQAGFAMICAGSVRRKNVQNTTLKNLLDVCGAAIAFYAVGYAFAFGSANNGNKITFIGSSNFLLLDMVNDETGIAYCHWLFQFAFAATSGETFYSIFHSPHFHSNLSYSPLVSTKSYCCRRNPSREMSNECISVIQYDADRFWYVVFETKNQASTDIIQ
jgi:hypothetical protein